MFVDCEHFFDGYRHDPDYGVELLRRGGRGRHVGRRALRHQRRHAARAASAPSWPTCASAAACAWASTARTTPACAVANTIAAVEAGATHVQCTANGYGERTGNADLFAVVGNLEMKLDMRVLPEGKLAEMVRVSHALADIANLPPNTHQAYVGVSAFAHKAGLHASAIKVNPDALQPHGPRARRQRHARSSSPRWPAARRSSSRAASSASTCRATTTVLGRVVDRVKDLESQRLDVRGGRRVVRAAAARRAGRRAPPALHRGVVARRSSSSARTVAVVSEATVKVHAGGERIIATGEGNGPVNALDNALRAGAHRRRSPSWPGSSSSTTRCASSTASPAPTRSPACWSAPPTARTSGRRRACTRTSSRRPGWRSRTRSPTACSRPGAWRRPRAATD